MKINKEINRLTRPTTKSNANDLYKKKPNVYTADCIEKLGHYEDLEEHGRLIKLPCAVGDTVYEVLEESAPLPHFYIAEYEVQDVSTKAVKYADDWASYNYSNLFFTKEEAKKKLEEVRKNEEKK